MADTNFRALALDRLCRRKRELDNAKAPFDAAPWDALTEDRRASYRAAMEPFVDALGDMLTPPTAEELAQPIHSAICYDSPEECAEFGGKCLHAADRIVEWLEAKHDA